MNEIPVVDLALAELSHFEPHLETAFTFSLGEQPVTLTLVEVLSYPDHRPEGAKKGRAPFALIFGSPDQMLEQGGYRLKHEELGYLDVFLSPFEVYEKGCKLEGIFN